MVEINNLKYDIEVLSAERDALRKGSLSPSGCYLTR